MESKSNLSKVRRKSDFAPIGADGTGGITISKNRRKMFRTIPTFKVKKVCIKHGNLSRLIDLTKPWKRVIYGVTKEEVNHGEDHN